MLFNSILSHGQIREGEQIAPAWAPTQQCLPKSIGRYFGHRLRFDMTGIYVSSRVQVVALVMAWSEVNFWWE